MGRKHGGIKVFPRRGTSCLYVRFTHEGHRYTISTGEADLGRAEREAARIYADTIAGKRTLTEPTRRSSHPLPLLFAQWLATLDGIHDEKTVETYTKTYVKKHFIPFFEDVQDITEGRIAEYGRARLRVVLRKTLRKELSALRGFLVWAKHEGHIDTVPSMPEFPRTLKGVRAGRQREKARELTPEQVEAVLAALPERSRSKLSDFVVWARFAVAFDTTLRPSTLDALELGVHWSRGDTVLRLRDEDDKARYGRTVPLTERARGALASACVGLKDGQRIFGKHDYRQLLKRASEEAGVPYASVCAYDLRHARITQLVETGHVLGAMHMAGHSQISTTSVYTHPTLVAAEKAIEAATDPRA